MQRPSAGGQRLDARARPRDLPRAAGHGAACVRASITSDPRQPQCLCSTKLPDAVDVGRRIGARERHPEKVVQRCGRQTRCRRPRPPAESDSADGQRRAGRPVAPSRWSPLSDALPANGRPCNGQHARQAKPAAAKAARAAVRPASSVGKLRAQRPGGRDHQLRAFVQAGARVVERVDRRAGLKVQVAPPVDALEQMPQETRRCRERRAPGSSSRGHDQQILGQRQLPLAQHGVGQREQFGRTARALA